MNRIVHLGVGNFHRAHQAWYTAQAGGWRITGGVMSNAALKAQLADHDNAYALGIWGPEGLRVETINVYDDVLLASEEAIATSERIADPDTHIVTLTITEKGYCLRPDGSGLDLDAKPIRTDLANETPKSAIGILCDGLIRRQSLRHGPITLISCDNLADNGEKLSKCVLDFLQKKDPDTFDWVSANVTFPNSMVDRITPRLSETAQAEITNLCPEPGISLVGTEEFSEWVIEDRFAGPRPDWHKVGVQIVPQVAPFEERKLRMLNAAHSYLAYAGVLAGHTYVHEAIADAGLREGVNALWQEAGSTVSEPAASTLDAYRAALLDRFSVPAMRHALMQIAMDGSMKLKERLLPIKAARQQRGEVSPMTEKAIHIWAEFVVHQCKAEETLNDPNAQPLAAIVAKHGKDAQQAIINWLEEGSGQ